MSEREVSAEDKALAADWHKRIKTAVARHEEAFKGFERNRVLLRGRDPENPKDVSKQIHTNLYFANLATMRPQVYAKDPEFAVRPKKSVPEQQLEIFKAFGETSELLLHQELVKGAGLKTKAKRTLTSTFTTAVGWWKLAWQEPEKPAVEVQSPIKDSQDNMERVEMARQELADPKPGLNQDLAQAQLTQAEQGLQAQAEVKIARGPTLDFVLSEDIIILDESVREIADYKRARAIAHRIWMTRDQYRQAMGYECVKGTSYVERSGTMADAGGVSVDQKADLLQVFEIWDQDSNRIFTVCMGEEGFCKEPFTPDWTGRRWYPFFLLVFNEVDGFFYPPSDVELIRPLVEEYNENRNDQVQDRRGSRPIVVVRKGGSLTPNDIERLKNRGGDEIIMVEGVGGRPLSDDLWMGSMSKLDPMSYDTSPARSDIEQLLGGGDASRGTVMKAKTATEAEILARGLRSRSAERTDIMEDLLTEAGTYCLEMMLRKLSPEDVKKIAGESAVWPQMTADEVFESVSVEVQGGSTGKPDQLQEQDRWTKLLPVIQEAMAKVAELRATPGGAQQADAIIALVKETLRRFEERLDIEALMPAAPEGQQPADPMQDPQVQQIIAQGEEALKQLQEQLAQAQQQLQSKEGEQVAKVEMARINAERDVEVAKVTAPIDAQAKVEAERIRAEAAAAAKAQQDAENAARAAQEEEERAAAEAAEAQMQPEEPEGPSEVQMLADHVAQLTAGMQQMAQMLAQMQQASGAPKPRMKVVHDRDPKTNRINASRLVPDEQE